MITKQNPTYMLTPSRWRRIFCSLFLVAGVVVTIAAIASPQVVDRRVGSNVVNRTGRLDILAAVQGATPTPTPTPTPTCTPSQFHVLIVYSDTLPPIQLQGQILAEPGVTTVDLFDAASSTPTLGQLQQYELVVPLSNIGAPPGFLDATTLGDNLADYVDGGGVVVQYGFTFYGPSQPHGVNGRWVTGNYNPFDYSTNFLDTGFTLGTFNAGHPLMSGVTTLNSGFADTVTLAAGATEVAQTNFGTSLVAFRPVSGGHTTVGVTAYVGATTAQSGDWGKVIANAGRWLISGPCPTATPTPSLTPSPTPSVTPTATPRATPTPRPRPTPHPRP